MSKEELERLARFTYGLVLTLDSTNSEIKHTIQKVVVNDALVGEVFVFNTGDLYIKVVFHYVPFGSGRYDEIVCLDILFDDQKVTEEAFFVE